LASRGSFRLGYGEYKDRKTESDYVRLLGRWLTRFVLKAKTVWFSYNAKWTFEVGKIVTDLTEGNMLEAAPCVQVFTFGQWPPQGKIVENIVEVLGLYRSLCRDEMRLDGAPMSMVVHAQREVKKAQQSIIQMFLGVRQP
jgi:hypothetical protein